MFFLLFAFWIILNGRWTAEVAIVGVVVSGLIYLLAWKFMDYSPRKEWAVARRIPRAFCYFCYLVGEVFKSAWQVIKFIWSPKVEVQPEVTSFHTRLRTDAGKVVLANSITLTPGTITVDIRDNRLLVHCLDESLDSDLEGSGMEQRIMKVEGGRHHD